MRSAFVDGCIHRNSQWRRAPSRASPTPPPSSRSGVTVRATCDVEHARDARAARGDGFEGFLRGKLITNQLD